MRNVLIGCTSKNTAAITRQITAPTMLWIGQLGE